MVRTSVCKAGSSYTKPSHCAPVIPCSFSDLVTVLEAWYEGDHYTRMAYIRHNTQSASSPIVYVVFEARDNLGFLLPLGHGNRKSTEVNDAH